MARRKKRMSKASQKDHSLSPASLGREPEALTAAKFQSQGLDLTKRQDVARLQRWVAAQTPNKKELRSTGYQLDAHEPAMDSEQGSSENLPSTEFVVHQKESLDIPAPAHTPRRNNLSDEGLISQSDADEQFTKKVDKAVSCSNFLPCQRLVIGNWSSTGCMPSGPLLISCCFAAGTIIYAFKEGDRACMIEYAFESIKSAKKLNAQFGVGGHTVSGIIVELNRPPKFFRSSSEDFCESEFLECDDFTKGQQASKVLRHRLIGDSEELIKEFDKIKAVVHDNDGLPFLYLSQNELTDGKVAAHEDHSPILDQSNETLPDSAYVSLEPKGPPGDMPVGPPTIDDRDSAIDSPNGAVPTGRATEAEHDSRSDKDERTTYSIATTIIPRTTRELIAFLCDNIIHSIWKDSQQPGHICDKAGFPALVKAFAIQLGLNMSNNLNQRIMHFVHKHHQEIARQLVYKIDKGTEIDSEPSKPAGDVMSLVEKMSMWEEKSSPSAGENHLPIDLFDGVKDDDEPLVSPELANYGDVILGSEAYQWLLSRLDKKASLNWGVERQDSAVSHVREVVLASLATGRISKAQPPRTFETTFHIAAQPCRDGTPRTIPGSGNPSLAECFVLTCSSPDEIQGTTVKQYLRQTWPDTANLFLDIIQSLNIYSQDDRRVLDNSLLCLQGETASSFDSIVTTPQGLTIQLILEQRLPVIKASGPAYLLAEFAELLAWIQAVISVRKQGETITPSAYRVDNSNFRIESRPQANMQSPIMTSLQPTVLQELLIRATIVRGYPTARRPGSFSGIELSWLSLLSLGLPSEIDIQDGHFQLRAPYLILELAKQADKVLLWHVLTPLSSHCSCYETYASREKAFDVGFDPNIALYRHIVMQCQTAGCITNMPLHSHQHMATDDGDKHMIDQTADSNTNASTPESIVPFSSSGAIDSGMLSISGTSEDDILRDLGPESPLYPAIIVATDGLIGEFRACFNEQQPSDGESSISDRAATGMSIQGSAHHAKKTNSNSRSTRKRCASEKDDDVDEDGFQRPQLKRLQPILETKYKVLACPFWKLDPGKYNNCFSKKLGGIARVKQHLKRNHNAPAIYCQRCLQVFGDRSSLNAHMKNTLCPIASFEIEGILPEKQDELTRKSDPTLSEEQQWFAIWDILFPRRERPASAYKDDRLSRDCVLFQDFVEAHAPRHLTQALSANAELFTRDLETDVRNQAVQQVISGAFKQIIDTWTSSHTSSLTRQVIPGMASSSSQTMHSSLHTEDSTQSATPSQSFADSGVWVRARESNPSVSDSAQQTATQALILLGGSEDGPAVIESEAVNNTTIQSPQSGLEGGTQNEDGTDSFVLNDLRLGPWQDQEWANLIPQDELFSMSNRTDPSIDNNDGLEWILGDGEEILDTSLNGS